MSAGPHRSRRLGGRVLVVGDAGSWEMLSEAEHARWTAGLAAGDPLWPRLEEKGLLGHCLDFDRLGTQAADASFGWSGPRTHVVVLSRGRLRMGPETARDVADFILSVPGALEVELEGAEAAWASAMFLVEYLHLRAEWGSRRLRVWCRAGPRGLSRPRTEDLARFGVRLRVVWRDPEGPGAPAPSPLARAGAFFVGAATRDPEGWAAAWTEAGLERVRIEPSLDLLRRPDGPRRFAEFYARALAAGAREERADWVLRRVPGPRPPEELAGPPPGTDVLAELAYDPEGRIHTSELALDVPGGLLELGRAGRVSYEELPGREAVQACLAVAQGEHHPQCASCAYKPFCVLPVSANLALQGTAWGRAAESPLCAARMGAFDALFLRFSDVKNVDEEAIK